MNKFYSIWVDFLAQNNIVVKNDIVLHNPYGDEILRGSQKDFSFIAAIASMLNVTMGEENAYK